MSYGHQNASYQQFNSGNGYNNAYPPSMSYNNNNQYGASTDSFGQGQSDPFADTPYNAKEATSYNDRSAAQAQHSAWMEGGKEPAKGSAWKKWATIGGLVLLVVAGIAGGIAAWKLNANSKSGGSGSSSSSSSSSSNADKISAGADPSVFDKDPRLKQSFYGFAYTPEGTILPNCGGTQAQVTADIQLLSQLTTRIRSYGSDCNATNMLLQAIQDTKVDMQIWLGVYVNDDNTIYERQKSDTLQALQTYGTDHVAGITVGNEYILGKNATAASYKWIADKVVDFRTSLAALKLSKDIPIGTADAASVLNKNIGTSLDYSMANLHAWFGELRVQDAADWTWQFFQDNNVGVQGNGVPYIAETGWPTNAMEKGNLTLGGAVAGVPELQTFIDTFVCQANTNQTRYFFFEAFDEPWKEIYGGVEPYWGLFDDKRNLKDVTIPDCKPGDY